jgi:hypothetical protein
MGALVRLILSLFGLGAKKERRGPVGSSATPVARAPRIAPPETLSPTQMREARRRVIAYVARSRVPLRQVVTIRQQWLVQLGKVYESIASSPTDKVLELAGQVGENYEPGFRDALMLAQSIEPPPECEAIHAAMIGWMTALHSACLALIDARKLKDRSMLSQLREQLGAARKHSSALIHGRAELFQDYRLNLRPTVQKRKPKATRADAPAEDTDAEPAERPRQAAPPRRRLATASTRPPEKRGTKTSRTPQAATARSRKRPAARPAR